MIVSAAKLSVMALLGLSGTPGEMWASRRPLPQLAGAYQICHSAILDPASRHAEVAFWDQRSMLV